MLSKQKNQENFDDYHRNFLDFFGISNKIYTKGGDKNETQRRDDLQCKKYI